MVCDGNCVFHVVCGSFFVLSTVISCVGTLLGSGACDECLSLQPIQRMKTLLFPPRPEEMKK